MKLLAVTWVGVHTESFDRSLDFFEQVLGLRRSLVEPNFAVLATPSGDAVEIFGPRAALSEPAQFDRNPVVVGLMVDDIDAARSAIEAAGATLLGDIVRTAEGYAWQHFIGPDRNTWELTYDPAHPLMR